MVRFCKGVLDIFLIVSWNGMVVGCVLRWGSLGG